MNAISSLLTVLDLELLGVLYVCHVVETHSAVSTCDVLKILQISIKIPH